MFASWYGADDSVDAETVLEDFRGETWSSPGISADPEITAGDMDLIVAWYEYESYEGSAFVVYRDRRDGKVYQVLGGHCSCYGLEGQWQPEEVSAAEILARPEYVETYGWSDEQKAESRRVNEAMRTALTEALAPASVR